jgi:hypothetical protein
LVGRIYHGGKGGREEGVEVVAGRLGVMGFACGALGSDLELAVMATAGSRGDAWIPGASPGMTGFISSVDIIGRVISCLAWG